MDEQELMDMVAAELMDAIEKKDKKMLLDALRALCMHIKDADEAQEE